MNYRVIGMDNGCEVREYPDGSREKVKLAAPPSGAPTPAADELKAMTEQVADLVGQINDLTEALEKAEAKVKELRDENAKLTEALEKTAAALEKAESSHLADAREKAARIKELTDEMEKASKKDAPPKPGKDDK